MKKVTLFGMGIFIILVSSLVQGSTTPVNSRNTIYVDDDNLNGPWDGSFQHPFQHIRDGIAAASSGDTVFVFEGSYNEDVYFGKSLEVKGENRDNTIIHGLVRIQGSEWAILNGFTIRSLKDVGIIIYSQKHITVHNNSILNCTGTGIAIQECCNSTFSNNIISGNRGYGLESWYNCCSNCFFNNTFIGNWDGGIYGAGYCSNNYYIDNVIYGNGGDGGYYGPDQNSFFYRNIIIYNSLGLDLSHANGCMFEQNNILNNSRAGLWGGTQNTIKNNIISDNGWDGIFCSSNSNFIENNSIIFNKGNGIQIQYCQGNIIKKNTIESNNKDGIEIIYRVQNNKIENNSISNNNGNGITMIGGTYGKNKKNIISYNMISNNSKFGIYISGGILSRNRANQIYYNEISYNIKGGIFVEGGKKVGNNFNQFFFNNLIENTNSSYDSGFNLYLMNYWSDFNGFGMYKIPGGINRDPLPLRNPII